jgi:hypothetical protein
MFLFLLLLGTANLRAQINSTPFEQVFVTASVKKESLKKDCPHLYQVVSNKDYKTEDVNAFIKAHANEWKTFTYLPAVQKLNIAWNTLGLTTPEPQKVFPHSLYQWYKAANVSEASRKSLFPHFPLPDLKNEQNAELKDYEAKIGAWQRLYPEEYERFLNAPQMTDLNPYYNGYYTLPYLPKFIGSDIGVDKPVKKSTGNELADEYQYQLKMRNWLFVFKPQEFNRQFGKDYKFPADFNQQEYRDHVIKIAQGKKDGTYPNTNNPH